MTNSRFVYTSITMGVMNCTMMFRKGRGGTGLSKGLMQTTHHWTDLQKQHLAGGGLVIPGRLYAPPRGGGPCAVGWKTPFQV